MKTTARAGVAVIVLMLSACSGSGPTSPSATNPQSSAPPSIPPPAKTFPPLTGPSRTFVFDHELSNRVADYTKNSAFVLYDDGAFVLQYRSLNVVGGGYRGGYTEMDGVITFEWEGWSVAGPWEATGTLKDGMLTVRYNFIMQLTDFEDAAYVLVQ